MYHLSGITNTTSRGWSSISCCWSRVAVLCSLVLVVLALLLHVSGAPDCTAFPAAAAAAAAAAATAGRLIFYHSVRMSAI